MSEISAPFSDRVFTGIGAGERVLTSDFRNPFDRDRDRILHSTAFRRLAHKTQVIFDPQDDHVRTRLTHSIEVSQIARSLARYFGASEPLTEAIALGHDLGHAPFGHTGEEALLRVSNVPFFHNDHTLRIILSLEQPYKPYGIDGLNLTRTTIESIALHNGPIKSEEGRKKLPYFFDWLAQHDDIESIDLTHYGGLEAQIAAIADDVAYICHDLDDALRLKKISIENAIESNSLLKKVWEKICKQVSLSFADSSARVLLVRSLIHEMVNAIIEETKQKLENEKIRSYQDIRDYNRPIIHYNDHIPIKEYLKKHYWKNEEMQRFRVKYHDKISLLYQIFQDHPTAFVNEKSRIGFELPYPASREEEIVIYIAGMTDRFALNSCDRLEKDYC